MKYKILLLNACYLAGLSGSISDYIFKSYRYIFPSKKRVHRLVEKFKELIEKENPDVICLIEIRKNQIGMFIDEKYKFFDFEVKYVHGGIHRKIPIFKNQGNAFLSKEKIESQKIFLKNGMKRIKSLELLRNMIGLHMGRIV